MNRFRPDKNGVGLVLTVGTVSVSGEVLGTGSTLMCNNDGRVPIKIIWGDALPLTADARGYVIKAATKESIDVGPGRIFVAAICVGASGQLLELHRGTEINDSFAGNSG